MSDDVAEIGSNIELSERTLALIQFTAGLTYEIVGRSEAALRQFERTEREMPDWQEGRELLYLFIGREHALLAGQEEFRPDGPPTMPTGEAKERVRQHRLAATEAYSKALKLAPSMSRAYIGLAGIAYAEAQDQGSLERCRETAVDDAIDGYLAALSPLNLPRTPVVESKALIGLGGAQRLKAEALCACESRAAAEPHFDASMAELGRALELARKKLPQQAAQAHLGLGLTLEGRLRCLAASSSPDTSRDFLRRAAAEYAACIQYAAQDPNDVILRSWSVNYCEHYLKRVSGTLEKTS
jgi:hypothetical protein